MSDEFDPVETVRAATSDILDECGDLLDVVSCAITSPSIIVSLFMTAYRGVMDGHAPEQAKLQLIQTMRQTIMTRLAMLSQVVASANPDVTLEALSDQVSVTTKGNGHGREN